jgi:HAD superfamily hydrolase (TIGR01509 family)
VQNANLINTVLFDWDGTLIDTSQSAFHAFQKSFRDLGIPVEFDLYEKIYSPDWRHMYRSLELPRDKWTQAEDLWLFHYGQQIPEMMPGARQTLDALHQARYSLGVVTSGNRSRVRREVDGLGLAQLFQVVVCDEDVIHKKPHPEGLETAMSQINKRCNACCYVGDSPQDVEMGKRAGIVTIGICGRYPNSQKILAAEPDFWLASISELIDCLEHRNAECETIK